MSKIRILCAVLAAILLPAFVPASVASATSDWTAISTPSGYHLDGLSCVDSTHCMALARTTGAYAGTYSAVVTTDGSTWNVASALSGDFENTPQLACTSDSNCWVAGIGYSGPIVESTSDFGQHWTSPTSTPSGSWTVYSIGCAVGTSTCLAGGYQGTPSSAFLMETTDGTDWTAQSLPSGLSDINEISCASATGCVAAGWDASGVSAYVTSDGSTWSLEGPSNFGSMVVDTGVSCIAMSDCTVVGDADEGGAIAASADGGTEWTQEQLASDPPGFLSDSCTDSTHCWAIAQTGGSSSASGIYATSNAGSSWVPDNGPSGEPTGPISGDQISCVSNSLCWAEIDEVLYETTDGGGTPPTIDGEIAGTLSYGGSGVTACVYAYGSSATYSTTSAPNGTYAIGDLPPGSYLVRFDPTCEDEDTSPYAISFYEDQSTLDHANEVAVGSNQVVTANQSLQLGSNISGVVSAPGAADLSGICVEAYSEPVGAFVNLAVTDQYGNYSIANLPVANYAVFVDPTCADYQPSDYDSIWYSSVSSFASAQPVNVSSAGSSVSGIDQTLSYEDVPLAFTTTSFPGATEGVEYSVTLGSVGGIPPYVYGESGLPAGLTLDQSTGAISGVPSQIGVFQVQLAVGDDAVPFVVTTTSLSLSVVAAETPTTTTVPPTTTTVPPTTTTVPPTTTTVPPTIPPTTTATAVRPIAASSGPAPKISVTSTSAALSQGDLPLSLSCSKANCSGNVKITERVVLKVKEGKKTVNKTETIGLASASYSIKSGKVAIVELALSPTGSSVLVKASKTHPVHETATATVRRGRTVSKAMLIT